MSGWCVYMVRCSDGSLYTGITTDVERRVLEHNTDNKKGAKYTKARRPVALVYQRRCKDRSTAASAEAALKQLHRKAKESLLS